MSDTRPFRQGSKLWLLETRAFQRLFARLSTSRKDAAACVSLSFLNDVKELRTHQRFQKPDTADEEFRSPCGGTVFHAPIASGGDEGSTAPEGTISSMHGVI